MALRTSLSVVNPRAALVIAEIMHDTVSRTASSPSDALINLSEEVSQIEECIQVWPDGELIPYHEWAWQAVRGCTK